ncbi:MAG: PEP-CTERM sorting domain-containing protein [Armatimonadetes bacterium]|nr:MAG: PEP-CTERM sorting domain-containing protein [Armatimonadota bacterium]
MGSNYRSSMVRLVGVGLIGLVAGSAFADVLISNMPGNDGSQSAAINNLRRKAMAFTTPAGLPYTITSVITRLNANPNAAPVLELHGDTGSNLPSGAFHTFTNPGAFGTGIQNYAFTGNVALAASTKYWLVMYQPAATTPFDWKASSPAQTPTGLATHAGSLFTTNGGTSWSSSSILVSYEIQATAVPEPATLAALGLGLAAVIRRKKR